MAVAQVQSGTKQRGRGPAALLGGLSAPLGAAALGLGIVAANLPRLRWAHLYRQSTGEGIAFFQVGIALVGGVLLATAGAVALFLIGRRLDAGHRRVVMGVAGVVMALLAVSALIALWVESHGMRCIGPCG